MRKFIIGYVGRCDPQTDVYYARSLAEAKAHAEHLTACNHDLQEVIGFGDVWAKPYSEVLAWELGMIHGTYADETDADRWERRI